MIHLSAMGKPKFKSFHSPSAQGVQETPSSCRSRCKSCLPKLPRLELIQEFLKSCIFSSFFKYIKIGSFIGVTQVIPTSGMLFFFRTPLAVASVRLMTNSLMAPNGCSWEKSTRQMIWLQCIMNCLINAGLLIKKQSKPTVATAKTVDVSRVTWAPVVSPSRLSWDSLIGSHPRIHRGEDRNENVMRLHLLSQLFTELHVPKRNKFE